VPLSCALQGGGTLVFDGRLVTAAENFLPKHLVEIDNALAIDVWPLAAYNDVDCRYQKCDIVLRKCVIWGGSGVKMSELRKGDVVIVKSIQNDLVRAQAIRFGIAEGALVSVEEVLHSGPIVLRRGLMRYALGRNLARQIQVEKVKGQKHA